MDPLIKENHPDTPQQPEQDFRPPSPGTHLTSNGVDVSQVAYGSHPTGQTAPAQVAYQPPPPNNPNQPSATHHPTNPGIIVLQWVTYALWGWTILAMAILTATVINSFIGESDGDSFTPYAIAAVLTLLPLSVVCDVFYSKKEPEKKSGAASIVMVIHAVLFALFGVGALIGIVVSLIQLMTSSSDTTGSQVALYSSIIIAILYASVLLRTLNPPKLGMIRRFFIIFMVIAVGIISVLGIIGPVSKARLAKDDVLIENSLPSVERGIQNYARTNGTLPATLSDLSFTGDAKKLVDQNLVEYTPNTKSPVDRSTETSTGTAVSSYLADEKIFYYQLCVNYKQERGEQYQDYSSTSADPDGYTEYLTTYYHPAGEECYKLKYVSYGTLDY